MGETPTDISVLDAVTLAEKDSMATNHHYCTLAARVIISE